MFMKLKGEIRLGLGRKFFQKIYQEVCFVQEVEVSIGKTNIKTWDDKRSDGTRKKTETDSLKTK